MSIAINAFQKVNPWYWLRKLSDQNVGVFPCDGVPTNGTSGTGAGFLGKGALIVNINTGLYYANTGTITSPTWTGLGGATGTTLADGTILVGNAGNVAAAVTPTGDVTITNAGVTAIGADKVLSAMMSPTLMKRVTGSISAADIVGTGAGQFGHANGVVLAAAPGANKALRLIALGMYYDFSIAAYTAGGNITVNWGSGGAALSGLVSAANSVGAASDKAVMFVPLSTAGIPLVSNASLNLVSSAAFTQPGTAAGVINWELWYSEMAVGF